MASSTGTKLDVYEIMEPIGKGGIEFLIRVKPFLEKN